MSVTQAGIKLLLTWTRSRTGLLIINIMATCWYSIFIVCVELNIGMITGTSWRSRTQEDARGLNPPWIHSHENGMIQNQPLDIQCHVYIDTLKDRPTLLGGIDYGNIVDARTNLRNLIRSPGWLGRSNQHSQYR